MRLGRWLCGMYAGVSMMAGGVEAETKSAEPLKVLMIGNSFSISVTRHLPQIIASTSDCHLLLASAYIGGCSLETHWKNVVKAQGDSAFKPYSTRIYRDAKKIADFKANVPELLKREKWDVVTIQQASNASWRPESFQPYADSLIGLIRQLAPQAEIIIQQTWAYRCDDRQIEKDNPNGWRFDQTGMYERLAKNYRELAEKHGLRVIPTGDAVQLFRAKTPVVFVPFDRQAMKRLKEPQLPGYAGDVVGRATNWRNGSEGGRQVVSDTIHLNPDGEYLQACVWFRMLFGRPSENTEYLPDFLSRRQAELLRSCADKAVKNYRQARPGNGSK